jgi:beta-xylosidase
MAASVSQAVSLRRAMVEGNSMNAERRVKFENVGVSILLLLLLAPHAMTQAAHAASSALVYHNPILFADYSDPDVIRDGSHFYLIASTFHFVPGIPILDSVDLVHWTIVGHVVSRLEMDPRYSLIEGNRYGSGIWAPSIRKHNGLFYVYFPTPTEGIFVSTAPAIPGPWNKPRAVIAQAGLEDPCPFWDDDGTAYLIHSRTGAGPLILHRMSPDGLHVLDQGKVIVEDRVHLPFLEGPKLYKRDGFYYIFAPFGGVGAGSQAVLRSKNIDGPYDYRVVLAQGSTRINGPHQGAYVESPDGRGWFIHFQSHGAHGRIVHLEPVRWKDGWPIVGKDPADTDIGQPIRSGPLPATTSVRIALRPQTSDEFDTLALGPQWEWNHNPDDAHWSLSGRLGFLRLIPMQAEDLLSARDTLTQSMQDDTFDFTIRIYISEMKSGVHAGLAMFEKLDSGIEVVQAGNMRRVDFFHGGENSAGPRITQSIIQLRVRVRGDECRYFFSLDDGRSFHPLGPVTHIHFSWWKGSRPALFAYTTQSTDPGVVDFDWAHDRPLGPNPW